jgi:PTS system nitrogen regulatory IIA component
MNALMFGHTLRMLRTTAGISLRAMAKKMEVSPAYLSQVELGKLPPPTHDRMAKIAETISIPVSLLIEMSHRPNPEIILLLRGHRELNELIKTSVDIGLESRDIFETISLMRKLGDVGFRNLVHYGTDHLSDFLEKKSGEYSLESALFPLGPKTIEEMTNLRLVFKKLDFAKKNDLLRYLIDKVGTIYSRLNSNRAYKKLVSNESEESSGIGNGVALPHLFVDDIDKTIISIARIPDGIDFDAIDNKPVHLVCLILSDPESHHHHLNLLAYFARKFQSPSFMEDILKAASKKRIISMLFDGEDSSIH